MNKGKKQTYYTFSTSKEHPQDAANMFSKLSFEWTKALLDLGNERQLNPPDLWHLQYQNEAQPLAMQFSRVFERKNDKILKSFFALYWRRLAVIGFIEFLTTIGDLYGPGYVLGEIISSVEAPKLNVMYILGLIASLYFVQVTNAIVKSHLSYMNEVLGVQFSSQLRNRLFEKSLRLGGKSRTDKSAGKITNLMSVDVSNILWFGTSMHRIWIMPIQIVFVLYLLYKIVGWPIFVGVSVVIVVLIINSKVSGRMGYQQMKFHMAKDDRMKVLNEVFGAIQIVKFNVWEEKFVEKIQHLRKAEVAAASGFLHILVTLVTFTTGTPILVSVAVFAAFTAWSHHTLTVSIVFSTIALFRSLQDPLVDFPVVISTMIQAFISASRLQRFLNLSECDPTNISTPSDPIAA
ncbi:ATP-binding Cassette (ABC) Superfamily, partial [Thraustotheca clavata]